MESLNKSAGYPTTLVDCAKPFLDILPNGYLGIISEIYCAAYPPK